MDNQKIKELLEKYWNAETTLEDEQIIFDYMQSSEASHEFHQEKEMFEIFYAARNSAYFPDDVNFPKDNKASKISHVISLVITPLKYAAVFLMGAFCVWLVTNYNTPKKTSSVQSPILVIDDQDEALSITKEALILVSLQLNKGKVETKKVLSAFSEINIMEYEKGY